jgi:hypothetical protein
LSIGCAAAAHGAATPGGSSIGWAGKPHVWCWQPCLLLTAAPHACCLCTNSWKTVLS